ncbi:MAG: hypothetical protein JKY32_05515 [Rhizobiales bacterium]|nr:hypothetical protein [Hyphomicrobiales bacterium]
MNFFLNCKQGTDGEEISGIDPNQFSLHDFHVALQAINGLLLPADFELQQKLKPQRI